MWVINSEHSKNDHINWNKNIVEFSYDSNAPRFTTSIKLFYHIKKRNNLDFDSFLDNCEEETINSYDNSYLENEFHDDYNEPIEENNIFMEESSYNENIIPPMNIFKLNKDEILQPIEIPIDYQEETKIIKKNNKFLVIYPKKFSLFNEAKSGNESIEEEYNKKQQELLNKKRLRNKEKKVEDRKYREYMVRRKIARDFFNNVLFSIINGRLKDAGSDISIGKFPKEFIIEVSKKCNKKILYMTLEQIFEDKELYITKKKSAHSNYTFNLNQIKNLKSAKYKEIMEKSELDKILKMKFCDLFNDYLSSDEFINMTNLLKKNEKDYDIIYYGNYIYFSKNFLDNYKESK